METGVEVCIEYLTKWLMISRAMMLVTSAFLWDHVLYLLVFSTDKKKNNTLAKQVRGFEMGYY